MTAPQGRLQVIPMVITFSLCPTAGGLRVADSGTS